MISSTNARQNIIHPVPGGNIIIHRYGNVFRVFLDCPEGVVEFPPDWIKARLPQLRTISSVAAKALVNCGIEVEVYGR